MGDLVTIELADGVADVRLNRPDKYNALSREHVRGARRGRRAPRRRPPACAPSCSRATAAASAPASTSTASAPWRAASARRLRGAGRRPRAKDARPDNFFQRSAYVWKRLPVPVIAAVHGVAYGGGFQIALGADIRIARPDARFSILEIQWGLVPDVALTQTVRDVLRLDVVEGADVDRPRRRRHRGARARHRHAPRRRPAGGGARARARDREPVARRDPRRQASARGGLARGSGHGPRARRRASRAG